MERGNVYPCGAEFGIRLELSDGGVLSRDAVDTSEDSVRRLINRLQGREIDAEQWQYILEDHLVREYTVRT